MPTSPATPRFDDLDLREEPDPRPLQQIQVGYTTDACTLGCSFHGCTTGSGSA